MSKELEKLRIEAIIWMSKLHTIQICESIPMDEKKFRREDLIDIVKFCGKEWLKGAEKIKDMNKRQLLSFIENVTSTIERKQGVVLNQQNPQLHSKITEEAKNNNI